MSAATAAAIIAAVAATGAAVQQNRAASTARKAEKKNSALQRAAEAFRNAQSARAAVARARLQRAQALAVGEAQGVSGSSSVAGASGAVITQTASQLGGAQVSESAAFGINQNNAQAARRIGSLNSSAALLGAVSQGFSSFAATGWGTSTPRPSYNGPVTNGGFGMMQSQRNPQAFTGYTPAPKTYQVGGYTF